MSYSIDELIYRFKLKLDKLDTNKKVNIEIPQYILYLNSAQMRVVNRKLDGTNPKAIGFEQDQKRIQELKPISMPMESISATVVNDNLYTVDLSLLTEKLLRVVRSQSEGHTKECTDKAVLNNVELPSNDMNYILNDSYNKPDFNWREVPVNYKQNSMYIYSDGNIIIDNCNIEYLRYPRTIDKAGYTKFDGSASVDSNCEFDIAMSDEIIDEAVLLASVAMGDQFLTQITPGLETSAE